MQTIPRVIQQVLEAKVALERLKTYLNQPETEPATWDTSEQSIVFENATIGWPLAENLDLPEGSSSFTLRIDEMRLPEGRFTLVCGPLGSGKTLFVSLIVERG